MGFGKQIPHHIPHMCRTERYRRFGQKVSSKSTFLRIDSIYQSPKAWFLGRDFVDQDDYCYTIGGTLLLMSTVVPVAA